MPLRMEIPWSRRARRTLLRVLHTHAVLIAQLPATSLSCVLVSKSLASWRSCNWLDGSPEMRLTMRPRSHGRPLEEHIGPALDVLVILHAQELGRIVQPSPSPARHTRGRWPYRQSCRYLPAMYSLSARRRSSTSSWRFTSMANRSIAYSIFSGA